MREVRTGVSEKEFNEKVAAHLQVDLTFTEAHETETGGGISCVVVPHRGHNFYFGTANELWGADVYLGDEFQDGVSVETGCPTSAGDALTVARALAQAVREFFKKKS